MSKKSILIVDDAKDILFLLTHSVKRLGPNYEVSTAVNAPLALEKMRKKKFDFVITDYMMEGMTGLDLAQEIDRISPQTQVVLMSAYDTKNLRDLAKEMGLSGFIGKPFTVPQVLEVIQQAMADTPSPPSSQPAPVAGPDQEVYEALKTLYAKTGAHYILFLNAQGKPLYTVGNARPAIISRLATFVSTNFLAVTELASLMGDNSSVFKSSYYEGSNYNIYAYNLNSEYFLAVVFGARDKPGAIWVYTKQTAATLASLLDLKSDLSPTPEADSNLAVEFDDLLGDEVVNS